MRFAEIDHLSTIYTGAIHLYLAPISLLLATVRECSYWLSDAEKAKANNFAFYDDSMSFRARRIGLRSILARYTGELPGALILQNTQGYKPYLRHPFSIDFNLSHSSGQVVYAVATRGIGVDIEGNACLVMSDLSNLIRLLHPEEQQALERFQPEQRAAKFLDCWTCKEAYLKATGEGLTRGLETFKIDVNESESAVWDASGVRTDFWRVMNINTAIRTTGAVAFNFDLVDLQLYTLGKEVGYLNWESTQTGGTVNVGEECS